MICLPCRDAADLEGITTKDRELLHDKCVNVAMIDPTSPTGRRRRRRPIKDCACQHRIRRPTQADFDKAIANSIRQMNLAGFTLPKEML